MKTILHFRMALVAKLIDHTKNATERKPAFVQLYDENFEEIANPVVPPGLLWCKDDGIYLISNGKSAEGQTPASSGLIAYAAGFNPETNPDCYQMAAEAVGGDDFGEFIDLEWIERAVPNRTDGFFVIHVDGDRFSIGWTRLPLL